MKKRIMLVFGTRPEAIKMAPVYRALLAKADIFETLCCVTGQHRDMLDQVLETFSINPDFDLDLMRTGQHLTNLHAAVLTSIHPVLHAAKPDLVLVHGDTTTTMAAGLAAFYIGIPVGHVEAGLRSGNVQAPFPEELNRRVADIIARYHFAPTEATRTNLIREGCDPASVLVTGNTVVDAVQLVIRAIDSDYVVRKRVEEALDRALGFCRTNVRYVIVTCHRRENVALCLDGICAALDRIAAAFPDIRFVFPVHRNPGVRGAVERLLQGRPNLHLIEPLQYDVFIHAMRGCHCIVTDSGGLQEEALALGKPVLVMRDVGERPEAIESGGAWLVGTDSGSIVAAVSSILSDEQTHARMAAANNPFGDGNAAERIATFLTKTKSL